MSQKNHAKSTSWELLRFAITGLVCALFDYLVCQLVIMAFSQDANSILVNTVSTASGFVVGVTLNYLMSTFWVYQNVDKSKNTKSPLFIFWFVLLSFGGLVVSVLAMLLCEYVCKAGLNINIVDLSLFTLIKNEGINFLASGIFWAYFISFCFKTLVGLVFNYFTRKYILYKAPKEEKEEDNE